MGRTVAELERSLSFSEWVEWCEFYRIDPWGEQRADMRSAQQVAASLAPYSKSPPTPADHMLFPDDRFDVPDEAPEQERRWMLELMRRG